MNVNLGSVILGFGRGLLTLDHLLEKGMEHCAAQDIPDEAMLGWQLAPDMLPLRKQVQFVCNLGQQWAARAADVGLPADIDGEMGAADLRRAIGDARAFVEALPQERFAGRDDVPLTLDLGTIEPSLALGQWIVGFATTNFYFHLSTAYAILRSNGVPLGKVDLFAGGL